MRIWLYYTPEQWNLIDQFAKYKKFETDYHEAGQTTRLIRSNLSTVIKDIPIELNSFSSAKVGRGFMILDKACIEKITYLSGRMNISYGSLVQKLVTDPIIIEHLLKPAP